MKISESHIKNSLYFNIDDNIVLRSKQPKAGQNSRFTGPIQTKPFLILTGRQYVYSFQYVSNMSVRGLIVKDAGIVCARSMVRSPFIQPAGVDFYWGRGYSLY